MFESLALGALQGIAEWLPVSSEGVLVLAQTWFSDQSLSESLSMALLLHGGTVLAAVIYFRADIKRLLNNLVSYKSLQLEEQKELNFYIMGTIVSVGIGGLLWQYLLSLNEHIHASFITLIIGILLLITAILLLVKKKQKGKEGAEAKRADALIVGGGQGLAVLPGVSRSGTTTSLLMILGFREDEALRMSFIVGIPMMIAGIFALILEGGTVMFTPSVFVGLLTSFIFGYITIEGLLRLARRVSMGWFVFGFAILVLLSVWLV